MKEWKEFKSIAGLLLILAAVMLSCFISYGNYGQSQEHSEDLEILVIDENNSLLDKTHIQLMTIIKSISMANLVDDDDYLCYYTY